jgi:hypothetical protein
MNRRSFLKFSLGATLSVAFKHLEFKPFISSLARISPWLGRTIYSIRYYSEPTPSSPELGYYNTDTVIKILDTAIGVPRPEHNPLWLKTEDGWLQSVYIQPVRDEPNQPDWDIPVNGFLAEVTVPYTQSWIHTDDGKLKRAYRYYYASTHWVVETTKDDYGNVWYIVQDDLKKDRFYHVLAADVRRISAVEIAPIAPEVADKRIMVNLEQQKLDAYENGRVVMTARVSTGLVDGDTPKGEFRVERKQPSRHMAVNDSRGNGFDLPGVPWVCFIAWTGVSMHGTYWHNDFGTPRSHGCINLSPQASKWIYRWTTPSIPIEEDYAESDTGTRVVVV